jgi:hypothetical protein
MNSRWFETFKQWTTGVGLVSVMALTASDALVLAGQGQQEGGSTGGAVCGWRCRASDILWRNDNGTTLVWLNPPAMATYSPGAVGNEWQIQGVGDFNANGLDDILWRSVYGDNVIWTDTRAPGHWIAPVDNGWRVVGIGDFDGGPNSDILWRSIHGDNVIWADSVAPGRWIDPVDNGWRVAGIGDFNKDGRSDILWRSVYGDNVIWPSANAPGYWLDAFDNNWQVQGVTDVDQNGESDIVWRCKPQQGPDNACGSRGAGSVAIWMFVNGTHDRTILIGGRNLKWEIAGVGDFDGNRWGDILWRCLPKSPTTACDDAGEGSNEIWYYSNGQYLGTIYSPLPALDRSWKVQAVGRFDR